ncbi:DcaP family trimeric outer membrane transporter [Sinimarinibacterium sp. CAU 1509]|uniref:DcaP family trimeric outer membrane transporter n=1 Tax=Sinimarinibacterium sp. CAU 1509 TaxID=2562283 RepID=UPI00200A78C7|nr:DcaP family trimeric outer membrane transporter [Sinimarinibacterium sp. CAU 1509]
MNDKDRGSLQNNTRRLLPTLIASGAALMCMGAQAGETKVGDTAISWGGYAKLDVLYSQFSEGEVAQSTSRDLYVPSTIPVSNGGGSSYSALDFHAKETRLYIKTETPLENGMKIGGHIEFDFIVAQGTGNEVVTNAYNPGLRRAFLTYGNWLLGQEWTTFINLGSIPETLDFVAFPTDGTVFARQPMIRYSSGNFSIAVENPETTVRSISNGSGSTAKTDDGQVPDLIARYVAKIGNGGNLAVAGMVRQLTIDDSTSGGPDSTTTGYGVSVSGKLPMGSSDDLRFTVSYGEGLGRYLALGTSADAALDGGDLEAIGVAAGYLAYRHAWNSQWRTTVTASTFQADNDVALTGGNATKSVVSGSINLLYSPVAKITTGVEYRHAEREDESGADGALDRLQFSAKYVF